MSGEASAQVSYVTSEENKEGIHRANFIQSSQEIN